MNIATLFNRRRYSFGRVFWVTLAIYLFFMVVGLVAMYVSPAMNNAPNWEKIFSWQNVVNQVVSVLFFVLFYFVTLNMFHRLIIGKHKPVHFVQPVVLSFLMIGAYYTVSFLCFTNTKFELSVNERKINDDQLTMGVMIFSYIISSIFIIGSSLLIAYLTYLRDEKKQRKILEEQKMQLEVEKSQANFNFLKAQINPHFLHNTLNFLYAKSLPYSTELSEGILTLSDIMRYALSPSATKDGKVMLKEEIEHVRNVIKINQLRFSNNLNVQFDVNGVVNGATIIPFILITLVENAFKHGDLKSPQYPIDIKLDIIGKAQMIFYCRNKKRPGAKELSTGIGLDNIKKQLGLTYGNGYTLNVKDEADFYTTELTINTTV
ncbi:MAG TPA: histidine kinase [Flavisolibacter sp.]|jgi:sensor histidine kinase YesM|nr:histidine kinase [Flavisolibacter sp.]